MSCIRIDPDEDGRCRTCGRMTVTEAVGEPFRGQPVRHTYHEGAHPGIILHRLDREREIEERGA